MHVHLPENAKANFKAVQKWWTATLVLSGTLSESCAGRAHFLLLCINSPSRLNKKFSFLPLQGLDKTNSVLSSGSEQSPVGCTHMPLGTCWMVPFSYILKRLVWLLHLDNTTGWLSPRTLPSAGLKHFID